MNKTAVDYFLEQLMKDRSIKSSSTNLFVKAYTEAKAKEKEQIRDAFNSGMNDSVDYFLPFLIPNDESENYYNETYNKKIECNNQTNQ